MARSKPSLNLGADPPPMGTGDGGASPIPGKSESGTRTAGDGGASRSSIGFPVQGQIWDRGPWICHARPGHLSAGANLTRHASCRPRSAGRASFALPALRCGADSQSTRLAVRLRTQWTAQPSCLLSNAYLVLPIYPPTPLVGIRPSRRYVAQTMSRTACRSEALVGTPSRVLAKCARQHDPFSLSKRTQTHKP